MLYSYNFSIVHVSMTKMAAKQHQKDHGHQLCKPLIEHVADGGCVSLFMHSPNRFLASKYSFFQPSRSSAESLYHCLQTREQWRRSTQSSCEKIRAMRSVGGRSAGGRDSVSISPSSMTINYQPFSSFLCQLYNPEL
eukprot:TRINITY_DN80522_c0_g1_i1.p1 TRINITY_DN80522_c0_g1~~TRINITY_DN80522_c0_g1_i1.p1  ORF type:complete len:137 (-),score=8.52 TRINITY_DN80522_c0_g1_i1:112-522(-)